VLKIKMIVHGWFFKKRNANNLFCPRNMHLWDPNGHALEAFERTASFQDLFESLYQLGTPTKFD